MNRIAGLAAVLGLVAAACSDSPTAPGNTNKPGALDGTMSAAAKAAWARSMGITGGESVGKGGLQYLVSPPPFWQTPFGTDLLEGDDDCETVNFGFVFRFYGRQYTSVSVNSNGNLTFDGCFTQFSPTTLPAGSHPIIAGLFSDWLSAVGGGAGSINFKVIGQAPLRRLVVTWAGLREFGIPGGNNTFQVQLLEFLSVIVMSYNGLTASGFHFGDKMTAGISGGLSGLTIVGVGSQIPPLDGHSVCLVSFGGGSYLLYNELICRGFVF